MTINLGLPQVSASQNQKEVTINAATGGVDAAMTAPLSLDFASGNVALTVAQLQQNLNFIATNLSVPRSLTLPTGPSVVRGLFFVDNSAGTDTLTVSHGTTDVKIPATESRLLITDGTANNLKEAGGAAAGGGGGGGGDGGVAFKGATLYLTGPQVITSGAWTAIVWDAELNDEGGFADLGAQATRLTIPDGVTKVELRGNARFDSSTNGASRGLRITKNGAVVNPGATLIQDSAEATTYTNNVVTAVLDVVAGDYFELEIFHDAGGSFGVNNTLESTWFSIKSVVAPLLTVQTTDDTPTVLASEPIAADSTQTIEAVGHGYEDATGDTYHFRIFGGARNEGGTSSAPTPNVVEVADAGAASWDATLEANDTTDEWEIKVTGEAAHTIDWKVTYRVTTTNGA